MFGHYVRREMERKSEELREERFGGFEQFLSEQRKRVGLKFEACIHRAHNRCGGYLSEHDGEAFHYDPETCEMEVRR
jgi:hypothetical protein